MFWMIAAFWACTSPEDTSSGSDTGSPVDADDIADSGAQDSGLADTAEPDTADTGDALVQGDLVWEGTPGSGVEWTLADTSEWPDVVPEIACDTDRHGECGLCLSWPGADDVLVTWFQFRNNGEVYEHRSYRIGPHVWAGHSDTHSYGQVYTVGPGSEAAREIDSESWEVYPEDPGTHDQASGRRVLVTPTQTTTWEAGCEGWERLSE